jgi:hypothetical protein
MLVRATAHTTIGKSTFFSLTHCDDDTFFNSDLSEDSKQHNNSNFFLITTYSACSIYTFVEELEADYPSDTPSFSNTSSASTYVTYCILPLSCDAFTSAPAFDRSTLTQ